MFFSTELLSRRDSGFGLLWLAATLGAKSSFKKLPRKSVLTADISQLCELIAEPMEPLALRLSSNLMVGVARVYKVKQEIFYTDVTTCFNMLKKAVSEMHVVAAGDLQMGQPTVRPDTVTIATDPTVAFAMDFEHLFLGWDDRQGEQDINEAESDGEYDPSGSSKSRKKPRAKPSSAISGVEQPRLDAHTLRENHDFVFNSSFDRGNDLGGGIVSSSSQFGGFAFDDNLMDLTADIGDELARELGEGWGGSPVRSTARESASALVHDGDIDIDKEQGDRFGLEIDQMMDQDMGEIYGGTLDDDTANRSPTKRPASVLDEDAFARGGSIILPLSPLNESQEGIQQEEEARDSTQLKPKKTKHVRLLLDARTELTNEELERARANYIERQSEIRREIEQKKTEKEFGRIFEDMMWGAPRGMKAPVLVDFWLENFRLQVGARSGQLRVEAEAQPPRKRRRVSQFGSVQDVEDEQEYARSGEDHDNGIGADLVMEMDAVFGEDNVFNGDDLHYNAESRLRSSEEPGQGRNASRPPSIPGSVLDRGLQPQDFTLSSQRSNLFPWDNAGVSSSISGVAFGAGASDRASLVRAGSIRRMGSSLNRESPFAMGIADSPASFGIRSSQFGADTGFEFDIPEEDAANESQRSDASALTLERNSFNFLEYAKMQLQAMPTKDSSIGFDDIVPKDTSTRHVAAAGFYHCLVLATKDHLGIHQDSPYGPITIIIK